MHLFGLLLGLTLPLLTLAVQAIVVNKCPYPLYILSVSAGGRPNGPVLSVPAVRNGVATAYSESSADVGRAIKVSRVQGSWSPILNWGYSTDASGVYTSISDTPRDQHPFGGWKVTLEGSGVDCPKVTWNDGRDPGVDRILNCRPENPITLTICA